MNASRALDDVKNERADAENTEGLRVSDKREPDKQANDAPPTGDADRASAPAPGSTPDSPRNAIGAYLLDALPDDERVAFEAFLSTSPETQDELRQLAPVVRLLPQLLDTAGDDAPAPAAALRARILTEAEAARPSATTTPAPEPDATPVEPMEALAEAAIELPDEPADASAEATGEATARPRTIRTAPPDAGVPAPRRPQRQRSSAAPVPRVMPEPLRALRQFPTSWLVAAGLAIVAVGAVIWALALLGRIDNKEREIDAQRERIVAQESEITDLRNNANATAFTLSATTDEAGNAHGTLLFSINDQIGVLYVRNLPPLDDERVYQLWYVDDQAAAPRPGGTFRVDRNGNGFIVVESDTPTFDTIALTAEPEGGSELPTTPIVLAGRLGGAAG